MGLEQKLSVRLSQRLVMTPTLQQAIKLLQMTRLELQDVVNTELVANPVLEEEDPESTASANDDPSATETRERDLAENPDAEAPFEAALAEDSGSAGDAAPEPVAPTPEAPAPEPVVDASTTTESEAFDQIDLEAYFGDYMENTA